MSEYYRPLFRRQIGDPTTDRDPFICTMTSAAMALDYHTQGRIQVWGGELEKCQDDHIGGTGLDDAQTAWRRCHDQTLEIRSGRGWAGVRAALEEGRGVVLQGDYDQIKTYSCQATFLGDHAEYVNPATTLWGITGDPLCPDWKYIPESVMRAYAEKLDPRVKFAVTAAHGLLEDAMAVVTVQLLPYGGGTYTIPAGASPVGIRLNDAGQIVERKQWAARPTQSSAHYDAMVDLSKLGIRGNPFIRPTNGFFAPVAPGDYWYVSNAGLVLNPNDPPAGDCTECEQELALEKQKVATLTGTVADQASRISAMKEKTAAHAADIADD